MKTLTLLKTMTFVMAAVIIIGTAFILYKITDIHSKSKASIVIQHEMQLDFPETINEVVACGDKLCLMTVGHEAGKRLIVIDPEIGNVRSILTFRDQV